MKEYIKIFTGTSILTNRLAYLLDQVDIATLVKDSKESARLAGFGTTGSSVELFIFNSDLEKASPIIDNFKKEISE